MSIVANRWNRTQALHPDRIESRPAMRLRTERLCCGPVRPVGGCRRAARGRSLAGAREAGLHLQDFVERSCVTGRGECGMISPNSFVLACSIEYFRIPRDVLTICVGPSTYARCGMMNVTPFDPEWEDS